MSLETRVKQLEKHEDTTETKPWLVIVYDGSDKPSDTVLDKAKADYIANHPDYKGQAFNVIEVVDEECKRLTEDLLSGKGTE